ncbi:protein ORF46 [Lake sturgeon herpesvirus]|nr:protein ORF46 [Lake sturgeon herpesvirus]
MNHQHLAAEDHAKERLVAHRAQKRHYRFDVKAHGQHVGQVADGGDQAEVFGGKRIHHCYDEYLTQSFIDFFNQKTNPNMIKNRDYMAVFQCLNIEQKSIALPDEHLHRLCGLLSFRRDHSPQAIKASPVLARLLIIAQFYHFALRYDLFYLFEVQPGAYAAALAAQSKPPQEHIHWNQLLPTVFYTSPSFRFHRQLFQSSKYFSERAQAYNPQIQQICYVLCRVTVLEPLALIPRIVPALKPAYNALVSLLSQTHRKRTPQNKQTGLNRFLAQIVDLTDYPLDEVKDFMAVVYHTLNAYINWTRYGMSQFVNHGAKLPKAPTSPVPSDLRCTRCFKSLTRRSTVKNHQNIQPCYCIDDRCFLSSCCEAYARHVPLAVGDNLLTVFTTLKQQYGLCPRCGVLKVCEHITSGPPSHHDCLGDGGRRDPQPPGPLPF